MIRQSVLFHPSWIFSIVVGLFALQGAASAQAKLVLGQAVERQLSGGEVQSYQVDLLSNQYVELVVDQRGIDVAVWLYSPNGKKLVESDAFRAGDEESVAFLGEVAGPYRVEIRPSSQKAPQGRYEIKIKELRAATQQDKYQVAARTLVGEGIQLERKATADSLRKAIEKYQQALQIWPAAGSRAWEASTLYLIAIDYMFLGEKQKALEFGSKALPVAEAATREGDEEQRKMGVKAQAYALDVIGRIHNELGDKKKALEYFTQALPLHKASGNRLGELYTISNMAVAYQYMGDFQKALSISEGTAAMAKELGDHAKEGTILNNVCVIYDSLGSYRQALDYCKRAVSIRHDVNDSLGEATSLNNLGNVYARSGDYQQALDLYNQSATLYKSLENRSGQGIQFNNIGWLYDTLGDNEKAIDFYNKALNIFTIEDDQYRVGNVLSNLAASYMSLGDYRKALEINLKVLPLRRAVNNNNGAAVTLRHIANAYAHLNEKQKALDYYNQSIQLLRENNPQQLTVALRNLGNLYRELGEQQNAIASLDEALKISRGIGDRLGEASTLAGLAQVERDRGNLAEAKRLTETALTSVESLRVNLKSQQLRASFFASVRKYHELYIDVLMRLDQQHPANGYDGLALQASENGRARSLLELLLEANADIRRGVDAGLVEREQRARQAISVKAEEQMRLLSAKHSDEEARHISQELDALANEYEETQAKIRQTSPRYAALTQPVALSLKEIQSQLLDENTVLLEYSLGEDRSFLWFVSPSSLKTFTLPKRTEVEDAARRVYDLMTASDHNLPNESIEQRRKRLEEAEANYPNAVAVLSRMLLGPVAAELQNKRLLIVAEGVLQYVPFSGLAEPDKDGAPLIVKHEIVTLPSASVLGILRRERKERVPASKSIAVFADPVFDVNDARLTGKTEMAGVDSMALREGGEIKRSANESGLAGFSRLRFTRNEANQIMKFAPRNQSLEALDFAASRTTATSSDLQDYRIVHFATHGIINSRHPELSGIVLSLVERDGKPQNGFLRVYDVYNMNLKADLVVLSACQTALGRDIKGEGLIGLTRAFMYGGATRVVATLWRTDDRATAALMSRFYEALLSRGMSAAAALRNAQVSLSRDKRWRNPRYWAGFTIQGEWK